MRIAVLPAGEDGAVRGVVEIQPAPGWITYWREPGEAGMPPQVTIAPESGFSLASIAYPPPRIFEQNDVRDIGYDSAVAFPFTLTGKAKVGAGTLKASVFIGICKDICVPFPATFEVPLAGNEAEAGAAIAAAEQRLPEVPSARFSAQKPTVGADGRTVMVTLTLPEATGTPELFLTGPEGYVYVAPALSPAGQGKSLATFTLDELPRDYRLAGQTWRLLVKAGGRAMETPLVFD